MTTQTLTFTEDRAALDALDKKLASLPLLERSPAIKTGMKNAGTVLSKQWSMLIPVSTRKRMKGQTQGHYKTNVAVRVWQSPRGGFVAVVGGKSKAVPHQYPLEFGHRIATGGTLQRIGSHATGVSKRTGKRGGGSHVGEVKGQFYRTAAVEATRQLQANALTDGILKAIKEALNT